VQWKRDIFRHLLLQKVANVVKKESNQVKIKTNSRVSEGIFFEVMMSLLHLSYTSKIAIKFGRLIIGF